MSDTCASDRPWRLALACMPALLAILLLGVYTRHLPMALIALGGAFTAGFGAFKKFSDYPLAPMLIVTAGMAVSAWIGSLAGNHFWLLAMVAAVWAALCAWLASVEDTLWWIVLQWSIALLVAGSYPGGIGTADHRALLMLCGGVMQLLVFGCFQRALYFDQHTLARSVLRANLQAIRTDFQVHFRLRRYGFYAASVVVLCLVAVHLLGLRYGYWAPMTALIVLKVHTRDTFTKGLQRVLGTLAGCAVASLIAHLNAGFTLLSVASLASAFVAYGLQNRNYSVFTSFITATAVLTVALGGTPEWQAALERAAATGIGAATAISVLAVESWIGDHLHRRGRRPA